MYHSRRDFGACSKRTLLNISITFLSVVLPNLEWFFDCLEAEKLCTKCAEKFSQESLSIKLLAAQIPLLVTSLEVSVIT